NQRIFQRYNESTDRDKAARAAVQCRALERTRAIGRAVAGRPVIAHARGAEVGAAAGTVGAAGDVVQLALVGIDRRRARGRIAGHAIDAADQWRRDAGPAEDEP